MVGFARDLRGLRDQAGRPSYRQLSARAHYSVGALSQAVDGRKLPSLPVTLAYVAACGGDTADWEQRWKTVTVELAAEDGCQVEMDRDSRAPYAGLAVLEIDDADRFFGRERLVADLVRRLGRQRFLGVFGPSGCGKSSLLRAGLIAHLREDPTTKASPIVLFTPGAHPVEECAINLAGLAGVSPGELRDEVLADPGQLGLRIRQIMVNRPAESDLVLVVDQFEEIFTLCTDPAERDRFITALITAATRPDSRARVVLGTRADFLGHCGQYTSLVAALTDTQLLVGPMTVDELRLAVTRPAEQQEYRVETALVARLVADTAGQPGALPLVSHALLQTWLRRRGTTLTLAGYEAAGGIEHALARTAEETYASLDAHQQEVAEHLFLRLTALGDSTEDIKRRVPLEELDHDEPDTAVVLARLTEARLLSLGHHGIEIAHEALIRHWPRLRGWLAEDRDGHRIHRRLTEAAAEWDRHERDAGLLYRGARLDTWEGRPTGRLNDLERTFLAAGCDAAERERLARRRRVRFTVGGLSSAVVIVTVLAVVALVMAARADDQRTLAEGRQLVADARAQLPVDPELGLLLAREAYRVAPSEDTEAVLRQATVDSHIRTTLGGTSVGAHPAESRSFGGAAFSPDGKHVVAGEGGIAGGTLQVRTWDAEHGIGAVTQTLRTASSPTRPVFSADGRRIAALGDEGVSVWEWEKVLAGQAQPAAMHPVQGLTWRGKVALSSDGQQVAVGGSDGAVRIWKAVGDDQPTVLRGPAGWVLGVAFSRDGKWLAGGGADGTVRLWNLADGGSPAVLGGHEGSVEAVAFSPDGLHLVSAGADGTVRVRDLAHPAEAVVLGRQGSGILDIAYSPDGYSIASAGNDRTAEIWNAGHAGVPTVLRGHRVAVWSVAFSPDGRSVAGVAVDGTVKTWDVDPVGDLVALRGHEGRPATAAPGPNELPEANSPVAGIAASADGRLVVSGGQDGTVRVWDVSGDRAPIVLAGNGKPVVHVAVSPRGRQVAAVDEDGIVDIWKTANPAAPTRLRETYPGVPVLEVGFMAHGDRLVGFAADGIPYIWNTPEDSSAEPVPEPFLGSTLVAPPIRTGWSPDGRHIAGVVRGTILLWDLEAGGLTELPGDAGRIRTLAFSPDGAHLAGAADDGTIHIWNIADPAHRTGPVMLRGRDQGAVRAMTFSQDSRRLITVGLDATVRVWKTTGTGEPLVFTGFRAAASDVTSLADGRYVTAHDDGVIRIWRCLACGPITEVLAQANRHVTRELTSEERRMYLPSSR
ncbi:hypothetical protein AMES_2884 [Amycolatopsis mediterranei S699]|uniref:WD-40 repeat-containing protein n=2 Tax=Amycolatopsis mediterranei TaxID=33910 RepID=A0A0H3D1A1_AMYMU|nr:WD-40 repeat-containing protein [Amycolatopsis mediterranei U32]AEK41451.1 hypothetical protein RAM_14815 [Amycolatopsis mediterranei S699]AGT83549.1 hypothetical protein B737_2885 [Amycolatopsis mediterranei RB]KDO07468.1 hypothetical protein DV26_29725 [Amycolatopsis mediterranei]AFO76420.1 hypothetical protein AMES_2884 [Amycolatopsis mediterranei S699]